MSTKGVESGSFIPETVSLGNFPKDTNPYSDVIAYETELWGGF